MCNLNSGARATERRNSSLFSAQLWRADEIGSGVWRRELGALCGACDCASAARVAGARPLQRARPNSAWLFPSGSERAGGPREQAGAHAHTHTHVPFGRRGGGGARAQSSWWSASCCCFRCRSRCSSTRRGPSSSGNTRAQPFRPSEELEERQIAADWPPLAADRPLWLSSRPTRGQIFASCPLAKSVGINGHWRREKDWRLRDGQVGGEGGGKNFAKASRHLH